jgi:hypothetical protein
MWKDCFIATIDATIIMMGITAKLHSTSPNSSSSSPSSSPPPPSSNGSGFTYARLDNAIRNQASGIMYQKYQTYLTKRSHVSASQLLHGMTETPEDMTCIV